MSEAFYVSRATIEKIEGVHRRARLELGTVMEFGVHGSIKEHYKLLDAKDLPLPVDYIVAATGFPSSRASTSTTLSKCPLPLGRSWTGHSPPIRTSARQPRL